MNNLFEQYKNLPFNELQQSFYNACKTGELEKVRYLLTSPKLQNHADLHLHEGQALIFAVENNQFDIVEYLTNSDELKEHISIHTYNDFAIIQACHNGDTDMVKFLLTSPKLKEHSDIYTKGHYSIAARPVLMAYISERMGVLEYLIKDYRIEYNDAIKYIFDDERKEITPILENMFKYRDLNDELSKDLKASLPKNKKIKL